MDAVDLILPALNEAGALPGVLARLPENYRAIVVDNGSTDATAEVARSLGATVVAESVRGYGAAVHAGLMAATAPVVAFADADGSLDIGELPRLVARLDENTQLVFGRRFAKGMRAWPLHARIANLELARRMRRATGIRIHDLGPMRVGVRQALVDLKLQDRRSGYPLELFLAAASAGLGIAEVQVSYRPRIGVSKVTGTLRGTLTAIKDMSAQFRRYA